MGKGRSWSNALATDIAINDSIIIGPEDGTGCMVWGPWVVETTKHFEAPTRRQAVAAANEWWKLQKGLKQTLRLVFPDGDGPGTAWNVVIHYEPDHSK